MKNLGEFDRSARAILGVALSLFGVFTQNPWGFLGIIPLLTVAMHWCPLYSIFGIRTCPRKKQGA